MCGRSLLPRACNEPAAVCVLCTTLGVVPGLPGVRQSDRSEENGHASLHRKSRETAISRPVCVSRIAWYTRHHPATTRPPRRKGTLSGIPRNQAMIPWILELDQVWGPASERWLLARPESGEQRACCSHVIFFFSFRVRNPSVPNFRIRVSRSTRWSTAPS